MPTTPDPTPPAPLLSALAPECDDPELQLLQRYIDRLKEAIARVESFDQEPDA